MIALWGYLLNIKRLAAASGRFRQSLFHYYTTSPSLISAIHTQLVKTPAD